MQALPQCPQFALSDWVFVHAGAPPSAPPHSVPVAHTEVHIPALHASPAGHTTPPAPAHPPQLAGSVLVLVQAPPQSVPPGGQVQAPAAQV
jgi:hypothetical protein